MAEIKHSCQLRISTLGPPSVGLQKSGSKILAIACRDRRIHQPAGPAGHGGGMTTTTEYCLTQTEVDKGYQEMMKRGQNGECTYESFNLAGGKLDAVMLCKTGEGDARMTMNGTVTPTTSDFTATMAMKFADAPEGTMTFTAKHERLGDCPAK